jgi:hypothetical protein
MDIYSFPNMLNIEWFKNRNASHALQDAKQTGNVLKKLKLISIHLILP